MKEEDFIRMNSKTPSTMIPESILNQVKAAMDRNRIRDIMVADWGVKGTYSYEAADAIKADSSTGDDKQNHPKQ